MQEPTRKDNVGRAACCLDIAAIPPRATRRARKGCAKKMPGRSGRDDQLRKAPV